MDQSWEYSLLVCCYPWSTLLGCWWGSLCPSSPLPGWLQEDQSINITILTSAEPLHPFLATYQAALLAGWIIINQSYHHRILHYLATYLCMISLMYGTLQWGPPLSSSWPCSPLSSPQQTSGCLTRSSSLLSSPSSGLGCHQH